MGAKAAHICAKGTIEIGLLLLIFPSYTTKFPNTPFVVCQKKRRKKMRKM